MALLWALTLAFPAAAEPVPRKILAFYNKGAIPDDFKDIQSTQLHQRVEMPLNYLGMELVYRDIAQPFPDLKSLREYRGGRPQAPDRRARARAPALGRREARGALLRHQRYGRALPESLRAEHAVTMAGIGFQLRKLMSEGGYAGGLKAYGYSAVITSGPFLMTALSFLLTQLVSGSILTPGEQAYLQSLVTHAFALSLLTTGTLNFAVTRFAADEHYRRDVSRFAASFFSSVTASALAGGPLALLFVSGLKASWPVRLDFLLLYLFSSGAWLAMIFLSAAKRYKSIVTAFLAGTAAGFACSAFLGRHQGLVGYFAGFALGQGLTLLLLAETLLREFGYKQARGWAWLGTLREHPLLVGVGFFYHLGIWVDKLVFRFSPHREVLDRGLYSCPVYDTPLFYAYLTILPTLGYFLIQTETEFFEKYRAYYLGIQNRENLASLESRRGEMVATLARSLKKLLWAQGALSALIVLCAPWLSSTIFMTPPQMGVFRIAVAATFLQAGFLVALNLLLYFDLQLEAFASTFLFCLVNAVLTHASIGHGLPAFGYGYAGACFVGLALAVCFLNERITRLHYLTFMSQPIPRPQAAPAEEPA